MTRPHYCPQCGYGPLRNRSPYCSPICETRHRAGLPEPRLPEYDPVRERFESECG